MSRRAGHYQIVRREGGYIVRWIGGNGATVLSSGDQLYSRPRSAERAILSIAREHTFDPSEGRVWITTEWPEGRRVVRTAAWRITIREMDERHATGADA